MRYAAVVLMKRNFRWKKSVTDMTMERIKQYVQLTEAKMFAYFKGENTKQQLLLDAMEYSLRAGGKRIRPVLALEFCRLVGGKIECALPVAVAIEMTHTFSLIHDDLPCMDNDDIRRGKPSCHKAFDEATALLAGDALAVLPYELLARAAAKNGKDAQKIARVIVKLAECVGAYGMIGGQQIDTQFEGESMGGDALLKMYELKTSRLLQASCVCGCIMGGGSEEAINQADIYGRNLGLAFQIVDDILDITGDEKTLGKPIGSDAGNNKETYVSIYGVEAARKKAAELTDEAMKALKYFDDNEFLIILTEELLSRSK